MKPIILASTSPRRMELLNILGVPFYTVAPLFDESLDKMPKNQSVCEFFAKEKLLSILPSIKNNFQDANIIISSDTVIVLNNEIIGKPQSIDQARLFLKKISNKKHIIETAIVCYNRSTEVICSNISRCSVHVSTLSRSDIDWYLNKNEWQDAAGAYKIQGAFQRYISKIEGTQSAVMGLPLFDFCSIVESQGYEFS